MNHALKVIYKRELSRHFLFVVEAKVMRAWHNASALNKQMTGLVQNIFRSIDN